MNLTFLPINVFRETKNVTFFDADIKDSNGTDVVIHRNGAISPPGIGIDEKYYVHYHQIDNNLVIEGNRTFTLLNPAWDEPHHVIYLQREMGALQIPIGTYHRSISGQLGSIVLNNAIRDKLFNSDKEFNTINLKSNVDLIKLREEMPVIWFWEKGKIKKVKEDIFPFSYIVEDNLISFKY